MFYITKEELKTHLKSYNVDAITDNDDDIVEKAITAAIQEAQSYLGRYQVEKLLPVVLPNEWQEWQPPEGFVRDENLMNKVKDIACWQLCKLGNVNIHLDLFRTAYEDAREWLQMVRKGDPTPYGWPRIENDPNTEYIEGASIQWKSNKKRNNHF